ncbi:MAG: hypothetical protein R3194_07660 [Limnobacter sp.]|nr:hypothetical protein [Limnobacter sp.]
MSSQDTLEQTIRLLFKTLYSVDMDQLGNEEKVTHSHALHEAYKAVLKLENDRFGQAVEIDDAALNELEAATEKLAGTAQNEANWMEKVRLAARALEVVRGLLV